MKNKPLIIILIIVILAALAFLLFKNKSAAPTDENAVESASVKSATDATTSDAALNQLEQENNSDNFSDVDTDFGADINAAAQ